jgi:hypothetical protein
VVPAYNEEARIGEVLQALLAAPELDEILVVNDGSQDGTAAVARRFPAVRTLDLPVNRGKGAAMRVGALETDADVLLFIDADLIGLRAGHVADLLRPVLDDRAEMAVGVFRGGRLATDLSTSSSVTSPASGPSPGSCSWRSPGSPPRAPGWRPPSRSTSRRAACASGMSRCTASPTP